MFHILPTDHSQVPCFMVGHLLGICFYGESADCTVFHTGTPPDGPTPFPGQYTHAMNNAGTHHTAGLGPVPLDPQLLGGPSSIPQSTRDKPDARDQVLALLHTPFPTMGPPPPGSQHPYSYPKGTKPTADNVHHKFVLIQECISVLEYQAEVLKQQDRWQLDELMRL